MALDELQNLSKEDLIKHLATVRLEIAALGPQIETKRARRKRSVRLLRGTLLTAGGFLTATATPLGAILLVFGFWDWVDAIQDDAAAMNQDTANSRLLVQFNSELDAIEQVMIKKEIGP